MKKGLLVLCLLLIMCQSEVKAAMYSDNGDGTFTNPVIFADVPDEDIIRVGDTYYMISTTMHMSPGVPVMRSYDLVNWEIVNYVYDYLEEDDARSLRNGRNDYAYGSWAASIRHDPYQGRYYVTFSCQTTPKSYFFVTDDIENGAWIRSETSKCYDSSFLFVDTGTECEKYMIIPVSKTGKKSDGSSYTYNQTEMCRLLVDEDTWEISLDSERTLLIDNNNVENPPAGLAAEGVHAYKIGEYYYFFMIQGGSNPVRQQICWRSKSLEYGTFEVKKVFLGGIVDEDGKTINSSWGIAQGGIVQTQTGEWYTIMFQDYHSLGRVPVLIPLIWDEDGWPIIGNDGKSANKIMEIPIKGYDEKTIFSSDEFDNNNDKRIYDDARLHDGITYDEFGYNGSNLKLEWQWNHNPDNRYWSLNDRQGYLRLKSGAVSKNIQEARNTLTQRTFGDTSGASIAIEVGEMREGDVAGLSAFQNQYGFTGVMVENDKKYLVMQRAQKAGDANGIIIEKIELNQDRIYLKVDCDFREDVSLNQTWRMKDEAYFFYSLDGEHWEQIGDTLRMSYDWPHFMGYRFGIFYYSTQETGGYVDVDYYHVSSVDGKYGELAKSIELARSLEKKSYYPQASWNSLQSIIESAVQILKDIPEDDSSYSCVELEEINIPAYRILEQLESQMALMNTYQPEPVVVVTPSPTIMPINTMAPTVVPTITPTVQLSELTVQISGVANLQKIVYLYKGTSVSIKTNQKRCTYSSANKRIVSVSSKGIIKARGVGDAVVKVESKESGDSRRIRIKVVKKPKVNTYLSISKKSYTIKVGDSKTIGIKKITSKTTDFVRFSSKNKKIVTVDAYGTIIGKKKGNTKIVVSCGKKSKSVTVKIK